MDNGVLEDDLGELAGVARRGAGVADEVAAGCRNIVAAVEAALFVVGRLACGADASVAVERAVALVDDLIALGRCYVIIED